MSRAPTVKAPMYLNQQILRPNPTPIYLFITLLLILFLSLLINTIQGDIQETSIQLQDLRIQPIPHVQQEKLSNKKKYMIKYCGDKCQDNEINILSSIIDLMENPHHNTTLLEHMPPSIDQPHLFEPSSQTKPQPSQTFPLKQLKYRQITYDLRAVKNHKLTSPKRTSSSLLSSIKNLFFIENDYEDIDSIFSPHAQSTPWTTQHDRSSLTVRSSHMIIPQIIEVTSLQQESSVITMTGLWVDHERQVIAAIKLASFELQCGLNTYVCEEAQCSSQYSAIVFQSGRFNLEKLAIKAQIVQ